MNIIGCGHLISALPFFRLRNKQKKNKIIRNGKTLRCPVWSAESIEKLRKLHTGNKYCLGYKHSKKTRKKMSVWRIGRKLSDITRQRMSEAQKIAQKISGGYIRSKTHRAKHGALMKKYCQDPVYRAKLSHPMTEEHRFKLITLNTGSKHNLGRMHTKKTKDKISKTKKIYYSKPENILKQKKIWENPEFKNRMLTVFHSQEYRTKLAKRHRCFVSKPENDFAVILDSMGIEYVRQHPITNILHAYPCDFFIEKYNMVLEVDGIYWHSRQFQKEIDNTRNGEMEKAGYHVLRFWDKEIKNIIAVRDIIENCIKDIDCSYNVIPFRMAL